MGNELDFSTATEKACKMGTQTVQALQNEFEQSLCLARKSEGSISDTILPMEVGVLMSLRVDLYNRSRMS